MCRLYAHIAPAPVDAADLLAQSSKSFFKQSKVRGREQKDGWGVGYFKAESSKLRAEIQKSPRPLYREGARFRKLTASVETPLLIAHIRAASNPRKLPQAQLAGPRNTQPFSDGKLVFAHNGTVNIPDAVIGRLGTLRTRVKGINDSEAYFWQFVKFYRKTGDVGRALEACMRELQELWDAGHHVAGKGGPQSGLNTLISDGRTLYAFCHYPGNFRALLSDRPWGRMVYARRGSRLVVASEPLDRGRWSDLKEGELLTAGPDGRVKKRRLALAC